MLTVGVPPGKEQPAATGVTNVAGEGLPAFGEVDPASVRCSPSSTPTGA
jgi:hypothetical protein